MGREDDGVRLRHMLDAGQKATEFASGRSLDELHGDDLLAFGLVHALAILGEAASRVSAECRAQHDDLPWPKMIGMRNRLVHGYLDINLDIVWDTVTLDLPPVVARLTEIVGKDEADTVD